MELDNVRNARIQVGRIRPNQIGMKKSQFQEICTAHKLGNPETLLMTLKVMENNEERETYLKKHHPILFIEILMKTQRKDCFRGLRDNYKLFTFYFLYYLRPWFESLRRGGRLKKGNTAHFK